MEKQFGKEFFEIEIKIAQTLSHCPSDEYHQKGN